MLLPFMLPDGYEIAQERDSEEGPIVTNLGHNPFGIQKQSLSLSPVVLITFIEWILIPEPILPAQPVVHFPSITVRGFWYKIDASNTV